MENASKALLIAGGILVAILIVTIAVYMFATYGKVGTEYGNILDSNEKIKFNTNFTKFQGRSDITAQEIVSLVNFVKDYKETNQIEIEVKIDNTGLSGWNTTKLIMFIKNNASRKFECISKNITYNSAGIVKQIKFNYYY